MKRFWMGIDVGGTFTDIVVYDAATGRQASHKELTTHADPARGVMAGIDRLLRRQRHIAPADIGRVVHATTLFSNALIERKGAPTGLITTKGFRDTLEIGRERKYELYDIKIVKPAPLVPRRRRLEVPERIAVDGSVRTAARRGRRCWSVRHELVGRGRHLAGHRLPAFLRQPLPRAAGRRADRRALSPAWRFRRSIDVAPEIREYERTSTTVINAYIKPLAERYLSALAARARWRAAISAPLLLMLSNGGLTNIEEAKRTPVQLLESGPAAGALVAAHLGARDGGDACAGLRHGRHDRQAQHHRRRQARGRLQLRGGARAALHRGQRPAGAHLDAGADRDRRRRRLDRPPRRHRPAEGRPRSAPAPSPAPPPMGAAARSRPSPMPISCSAISIPAYFVGGTHGDRHEGRRGGHATARRARGPHASPALAWGIHDIVNENMANAARVHIAEHGKDPRRYALLATGGAGPVHAYYVAKKLGLSRLIAPRGAGVASALGLLIAPARVDRVATVAREMDQIVWPDLEATFARLEADARAVLAATLPDRAAASIARLADIRYVGPGLRAGRAAARRPLHGGLARRLMQAFEASYVAAFTRTPPTTQVEIINVRVSASVDVRGGALPVGGTAAALPRRPVKGTRPVYFPEFREYPADPRLRPLRACRRPGLRRPGHRGGARVDAGVGPGGRFEVARQRQHHRHSRLKEMAMPKNRTSAQPTSPSTPSRWRSCGGARSRRSTRRPRRCGARRSRRWSTSRTTSPAC